MPLPRNLKTAPVWVSAGIFILAEPSKVGTSISPPKAAVLKLIGISQCKLPPSRWKMACSLRWMTTYKSPVGPPFTPASPSPLKRILSPSSTPAGILTDKVLFCLVRPAPWQVGHGSLTILPLPWHFGQVCCTEKKPCCMRTWPCPPQVVQLTGCVPGRAPEPLQVSQVDCTGMRILVSVPLAASSKDTSML